MTPMSIAVLSLGMSADAFAAAIGRGASLRPDFPAAVRGGAVFGAVEAVTPLVGGALGLAAAGAMAAVDHWIAFSLLAMVGGKMLWEALRASGTGDGTAPAARTGRWTLVAVAIGTSIDAAAVGVSLAILGADMLLIALSIGFTTFVMATAGLLIGRAVGARFGRAVEMLGGVVLIGLGSSILLEHLGWLG
ncbi:manganese efflux pump MntP family protein [Azospirillum sp. RWY-5-1]|uniref:Putative manganese efflux pump MntP n=1 Tax=Azospirillum oleiclasticum TaxID=2735135 RepID=A0ABX2TBG6_9PROT|nr:manganese efflux pump MntP family protein [Azospirillum oleiclasticum]NYZ14146.1 manganese efflux pump MntP family protein [Azospirillum oleiclasticum]NYZ21630.1 manganese efflux pump MntP family protein [Azospirillum oleiclasticum]